MKTITPILIAIGILTMPLMFQANAGPLPIEERNASAEMVFGNEETQIVASIYRSPEKQPTRSKTSSSKTTRSWKIPIEERHLNPDFGW